jgi:hypothetical protein
MSLRTIRKYANRQSWITIRPTVSARYRYTAVQEHCAGQMPALLGPFGHVNSALVSDYRKCAAHRRTLVSLTRLRNNDRRLRTPGTPCSPCYADASRSHRSRSQHCGVIFSLIVSALGSLAPAFLSTCCDCIQGEAALAEPRKHPQRCESPNLTEQAYRSACARLSICPVSMLVLPAHDGCTTRGTPACDWLRRTTGAT